MVLENPNDELISDFALIWLFGEFINVIVKQSFEQLLLLRILGRVNYAEEVIEELNAVRVLDGQVGGEELLANLIFELFF